VIETTLVSNTQSPTPVAVQQVHGGTIVWADEITSLTMADGIAVHADMAREFMIKTADCIPLVVLSADRACGLHVSRKTLLRGLLDGLSAFVPPQTITKVHIGPHICAE